VPVHTNPSTVLLVVISGAGVVFTPDGDREVRAGDLVAYKPREPHGMRAADERLVIAAVIAPRTGQASVGR
jgi:quercetin dioxygenase-like cupin family protein